MTLWQLVLLIGAGFLGGMANAMAGGASLFTFPAMMAVGLSPVTANASNSFALLPGNFAGAYVDRGKLPTPNRDFLINLAVALCGGALGAITLLHTSPRIFATLVPILIGMATLIFAFSKQIRAGLTRILSHHANSPGLRWLMVFMAAIYNGFFGAGVGVIFIAVLLATGKEELRVANAFKNVLSFISNLAGIFIYVAAQAISWPHGLVMMMGAATGGFAGGKLVQVLPPAIMRAVIITAGTVMTVVYAFRFWA